MMQLSQFNNSNLNMKIRLVCLDGLGNLFFLFYNIDELLNGLNIGKNGRIEKIISIDRFVGLDNTNKELYENDVGILGEYKGSHGTFTCILKYDIKEMRFWWIDLISNQWISGRTTDAKLIGNIYENSQIELLNIK